MKIDDRKPRPTRFGTESSEARLTVLRERAPTLGSSRRLRAYAVLGSLLMLLTIGAFYFAMQIYRAVADDREEEALIEVDSAPVVTESETEKALRRIEEEEAQAQEDYDQQLDSLKEVDLLEDESAPVP